MQRRTEAGQQGHRNHPQGSGGGQLWPHSKDQLLTTRRKPSLPDGQSRLNVGWASKLLQQGARGMMTAGPAQGRAQGRGHGLAGCPLPQG